MGGGAGAGTGAKGVKAVVSGRVEQCASGNERSMPTTATITTATMATTAAITTTSITFTSTTASSLATALAIATAAPAPVTATTPAYASKTHRRGKRLTKKGRALTNWSL